MYKQYRLIDKNRTWLNSIDAPPKDGLIVACLMPGGYINKMYLRHNLWHHAETGETFGAIQMLNWLPDHLVEAIL